MLAAPEPVAPPVIPPVTTGSPQLYVVPVGTSPLVASIGVTVNPVPLHVSPVMSLIAGLGLTVTVTVKVEPTQLPSAGGDVGVTVYVAVTAALVVLVSVPPMVAPLPATPPVKPAPVGAPQLYVVPAGTIPLVLFTGVTEKAVALQTLVDMLVTAGVGLTVMVKFFDGPTQLVPPLVKVGVTVIVPLIAVLPVLLAVNDAILSVVPLAANPIAGLLFVHAYVVVPPVRSVPNVTSAVELPAQSV
jgi:hypothetical protein